MRLLITHTGRNLPCALALALATVVAGQAGASSGSAHRPALHPTTMAAPRDGHQGQHAADDGSAGRWRVVPTGQSTYRVTWTAPSPLPITAARPEFTVDGALLGYPRLQPDGRTLVVEVATASRPTAESLDVLLSGRALDDGLGAETTAAEPAGASYTVPRQRTLTVDPGDQGPLAVTAADYELDPVRVAGLQAPVEMVGHVVRPVVTDPTSPLVLLMHGKHQECYEAEDPTGSGHQAWPCPEGTSPVPSHLGYRYLQRLLASQGYVTVSIAANGVSAQDFVDDLGAEARGQLVRRHLARWVAWDTGGTYTVDMDNVILVGHSRGGEGVNRAAVATPLSAPYRITGQVLIAPTAFERQAAAYVPTVALLPYCDGDVSSNEGQRYVDLGRNLVADDTALRSAAMILGANHNFFNTEWTPALSVAGSADDWGGNPRGSCGRKTDERLTAKEQRRVAKAYIAGGVALMARHDETLLPMFDGSRVAFDSAGDADVRTHLIGAGRVLRKPGVGVTVTPGASADALLCRGLSDPGLILAKARAARPTCGRGIDSTRTPHWPSDFVRGLPADAAFELTWSEAGQSGGMSFATPLDLAGAPALDLRTIVDTTLGDVRLKLRLRDASGASGWLTPSGGTLLPALPRGPYSLSKRWAQTLRLRLGGVSGVDLGNVTGVDLQGVGADGRVWVLDAAALPTGLAAVPEKRLATIGIDDVRVIEGDGPGTRTMKVPYTVNGDLTAPARVVLLSFNPFTSRYGAPAYADIPAGSRTGVLRLPYTPDEVDDIRVQQLDLSLYAVRGIMARDSHARAEIVDDDASPTVRVTRVESPVAEGTAARWRVRLSEPVDYSVNFVGSVVRGDTPLSRVWVADLGVNFRELYIDPSLPADTPVHQANVLLGRNIERGTTSTIVEIPLRRDSRDERREAISLRVKVFGLGADPVVRTVVVRDAGS